MTGQHADPPRRIRVDASGTQPWTGEGRLSSDVRKLMILVQIRERRRQLGMSVPDVRRIAGDIAVPLWNRPISALRRLSDELVQLGAKKGRLWHH